MPKYWGKQIFILGKFPEVGQHQKTEKRENTPGTRGGPGRRKNAQKSSFFRKKIKITTIFLHISSSYAKNKFSVLGDSLKVG